MADVSALVINKAGAVVGIVPTSANLTETYLFSSNPNEGMHKILMKEGDTFASISADGVDSTKTEAQRLTAIEAGNTADGGLPVFGKPGHITKTQVENGDVVAPSSTSNDPYGRPIAGMIRS